MAFRTATPDQMDVESALCLTQREWDMMANIMAFYLTKTPPNVLPDQRKLAERALEAARNG